MRAGRRFAAENICIALIGFLVGRWMTCHRNEHVATPSEGAMPESTIEARKLDEQTKSLKFENSDKILRKISVVSYCENAKSCTSIATFIDIYPEVKVFLGVRESPEDDDTFKGTLVSVERFSSKAEAFNRLIFKVKTDYFLLLDQHHQIHKKDSTALSLLFQTMEETSGMDLIGGSLLVEHAQKGAGDTLEIPCYRLHLYNYTYWETFEYRESVDDVMVCERTSTSFLANTSSFRRKRLTFDSNMGEMVFEDFFLRAKMGKAVIGTEPEVYFSVRSADKDKRSALQHVTIDFIPDLIPFGLKHHVMTIKDIDGGLLYLCERFSTMGTMHADRALGSTLFRDEQLLCDYDRTKPYWKMLHWAYGGMFTPPTMRMALKRCMLLAGDFFDSKNWQWALIGGGMLGALKTRGLLPWEAGDIDIHINMTMKDCGDVLKREFVKLHPDYEIIAGKNPPVIIKPRRGYGGYVTIFFGKTPLIGKTKRMSLDGYWVPVKEHFMRYIREEYSVNYMQHKMYNGQILKCKETSNSCLPNYRRLYAGRGGMWREFFEEVWGRSAF